MVNNLSEKFNEAAAAWSYGTERTGAVWCLRSRAWREIGGVMGWWLLPRFAVGPWLCLAFGIL